MSTKALFNRAAILHADDEPIANAFASDAQRRAVMAKLHGGGDRFGSSLRAPTDVEKKWAERNSFKSWMDSLGMAVGMVSGGGEVAAATKAVQGMKSLSQIKSYLSGLGDDIAAGVMKNIKKIKLGSGHPLAGLADDAAKYVDDAERAVARFHNGIDEAADGGESLYRALYRAQADAAKAAGNMDEAARLAAKAEGRIMLASGNYAPALSKWTAADQAAMDAHNVIAAKNFARKQRLYAQIPRKDGYLLKPNGQRLVVRLGQGNEMDAAIDAYKAAGGILDDAASAGARTPFDGMSDYDKWVSRLDMTTEAGRNAYRRGIQSYPNRTPPALLFLANARRVASGFIANAFQSDAQRKAVFAKYGSGATSRLKKVADKSKRESDANGDKRDFRYGGKEDLNKQTPEQIAARGASKDAGAYEQADGGGSSNGGTPAAAGSGLASTATIQAKPTQEAQGSALASAIVKAINEGKINPATTPAPWIDGLGNYNPAWGPLFSGPAKQAIIDAWIAAGGAAPDMGGMESIAPIPQAAEEPAPAETPQATPAAETAAPIAAAEPIADPTPLGEYDQTQPLTTQPALNINPSASATPTTTPTPTEAAAVQTNYGATDGTDGGSPHWSVPEQELMRRKNKQQAETVMEKMKTMPLNLNAAKRLIRNAVRVTSPEIIANAFRSDSARKAFFARGGARVKNPNAGQGGMNTIDGPIVQRPGGSGPIQSALGAKPATQFDPATGTWSATPRPPANEGRIMQIIAGQPQAETVSPGNDTQGAGIGTSTIPVNIPAQRQAAQAHAQAVRAQQNEKAKADGMANMDNLAKKAQRDAAYWRKQMERTDVDAKAKEIYGKRAQLSDAAALKYGKLLAGMKGKDGTRPNNGPTPK